MSTRIQQIQMQQDATFQLQVASSLQTAAFNVLNETDTTSDHPNRLKLAKAIIAGAALQQSIAMMPWILQNPTISAAAGSTTLEASGTVVKDSDLDFVIGSLFTQFADAFAALQ